MIALNKQRELSFLCICMGLVLLTGCKRQEESEKRASPIIPHTVSASPITPEANTPVVIPTILSQDMITILPMPIYLSGVFPEPASIYNISSDEYLSRLKRKDPNLNKPSVCASVHSHHLLEKGNALTTEEFINQMHLVVDKIDITTPNLVVSPDIFGSEVLDDSGEILFRTPDGENFNICWPVDLGQSGLHTATFLFTKTSGKVESYTWSFIIDETSWTQTANHQWKFIKGFPKSFPCLSAVFDKRKPSPGCGRRDAVPLTRFC